MEIEFIIKATTQKKGEAFSQIGNLLTLVEELLQKKKLSD